MSHLSIFANVNIPSPAQGRVLQQQRWRLRGARARRPRALGRVDPHEWFVGAVYRVEELAHVLGELGVARVACHLFALGPRPARAPRVIGREAIDAEARPVKAAVVALDEDVRVVLAVDVVLPGAGVLDVVPVRLGKIRARVCLGFKIPGLARHRGRRRRGGGRLRLFATSSDT